jgi:hypothetical protein
MIDVDELDPPILRPTSMWVPVRGKVAVVLPWDGNKGRSNRDWLREYASPDPDVTAQVSRGPGVSWLLSRAYSDHLAVELVARFGHGKVRCIIDTATYQACAEACAAAKPTTALTCVCACGGVTHGSHHGGVATLGWSLAGPSGGVYISAEHLRREWLL